MTSPPPSHHSTTSPVSPRPRPPETPDLNLLWTSLHEQFQPGESSALRVDWNQGVIVGARILGPQSSNGGRDPLHVGRDYRHAITNPETLQAYDGVPYILEHTREDGRILVTQTLGQVRNPRVKVNAEGSPEVVADLHLDQGDPLSQKVMRLAESFPALIASSHEMTRAVYRLEDVPGQTAPRMLVLGVVEVAAVACVSRGATVDSFFESLDNANLSEPSSPLRPHAGPDPAPLKSASFPPADGSTMGHLKSHFVMISEERRTLTRSRLDEAVGHALVLGDQDEAILTNHVEDAAWPVLTRIFEWIRRSARQTPHHLPLHLTSSADVPEELVRTAMRRQWSSQP